MVDHSPSAAEVLAGVAETLARHRPQTWRLLLAEHLPGPDGRCRACVPATRASPRWPCNLYLVAEQARMIAAAPRRRPPIWRPDVMS